MLYMNVQLFRAMMSAVILFTGIAMLGCGAQPVVTNANLANTNSNRSMTNINSANTNSAAGTSMVETKEPEQYQAQVTLRLEAMGNQQTTALPTLSATVARNTADRRMEFTMP